MNSLAHSILASVIILSSKLLLSMSLNFHVSKFNNFHVSEYIIFVFYFYYVLPISYVPYLWPLSEFFFLSFHDISCFYYVSKNWLFLVIFSQLFFFAQSLHIRDFQGFTLGPFLFSMHSQLSPRT